MTEYSVSDWLRDVNLHESIPPPDIVKKTSTEVPYVLKIHSIEGANVDMSGLIFSLTLFHSRAGSFFGRTFTFSQELTTFYHSGINDQEAMGICEIIQITRTSGIIEKKVLG